MADGARVEVGGRPDQLLYGQFIELRVGIHCSSHFVSNIIGDDLLGIPLRQRFDHDLSIQFRTTVLACNVLAGDLIKVMIGVEDRLAELVDLVVATINESLVSGRWFALDLWVVLDGLLIIIAERLIKIVLHGFLTVEHHVTSTPVDGE